MSDDNILPFKRPLSPLEQRVAEVAEELADWTPPTAKTIQNPHLINIKAAHCTITQGKAQAIVEQMDYADLETLLESMTNTAEFFQALSNVCVLAIESIVSAAGEEDASDGGAS